MAFEEVPGVTATLYGDSAPNADNETPTLQWTQAAPGPQQLLLGNGAANITYTPFIRTRGCCQLAIGVQNGDPGGAPEVRMRLRGIGDDDTKAIGTVGFDQASISAGAIAGGVQPWACSIDEFLISAGRQVFINIPWAWHMLSIGVYANGAPVVGQRVTIHLERTQAGGAVGAL